MKNTTVKHLVITALMAAAACVLGPLSVTLPISPVPISACTFVFYLFAYLLRPRECALAYAVYLLIGIAGLPVFSSFRSGIAVLAGPTGGYLVGYLFLCLICPFVVAKRPKNRALHLAGMVAATALLYAAGTFWLARYLGITFAAALSAGVVPYLIGDGLKIAAAVIVGPVLRSRIVKTDGSNPAVI